MSDPDEIKLGELLNVWEEAHKKDVHLSVEDLCAKTPHLQSELHRRIQVLIATGWMELPSTSKSPDNLETATKKPNTRHQWNRYQPGKLVGESKLAKVWCGFDVELHRVIAIKVLKQEYLEASSDFLSAAKQHAALRHPGIVQIHDIVSTDNIAFIILDFFEKGSLRNRLSVKGIEFRTAIQWSIQLAETLDFLHRSGVTHQNIKPHNILIDKEGNALLADAGLSHKKDTPASSRVITDVTPYMAPEQLSGHNIGPKSDIYSLAVIVHEMVTGHIPFIPGSSKVTLSSTLPPALATLLKSSLAFNPAERPHSVGAFAENLKSLVAQKHTRRSLLPVVAGGALAAAGAFVWIRGKDGLSGAWLHDLFYGSAQQQLDLIRQSIMARNPGFNGEIRGLIVNGTLIGLDFCSDHISDLHPISALTKLKKLVLNGTFNTKAHGKLNDLAPLRNLNLEYLEINNNENIQDITLLQGLPLNHLNIHGTSVKDLGPLAGSSLKTCIAGMTPITSLNPLSDTPVTNLWFNNTTVKDTSFMRGMSLRNVHCYFAPIERLNDLEGHPLIALDCAASSIHTIEPLTGIDTIQTLNISGTRVVNIKPLLTLKNLKYLWFDFDLKRDGEVLRNLGRLERLNNMSPADAINQFKSMP